MRLRGIRRARVIALVLVAAILASAGFLVYRRVRYLYDNLAILLVDRLRELLGREVAIGRVDAGRIGRVVLYDVAIAEEQRLADGTLIRTPRVVLNYRPTEFLWGSRDVLAALTDIVIDSPSGLLERDITGDWNVAKLFRPRQRPGRPARFRGRVIVRRGQLIFRDYQTRLPTRPAVNQVRSVDGILSFSEYPAITVEMGGVAAVQRAGRVQSTVYINPPAQRWLATVQLRNVDAAYWSGYLAATPHGQIRAGRADLELSISREGPGPINPLQFTVTGAARGLALTSPRLRSPLTGVGAEFQADAGGLTLNGRGRLEGMALSVSGRVLRWRDSRLALEATANGVTLSRLRALFPATVKAEPFQLLQPATVQASVTGPATDPLAVGSLTAPALAVSGVRVTGIHARWRYFQQRLQFTDATARGAGGVATAAGWVDLRPRPVQFYVAGAANDLMVETLASTSRERVTGRLTGRFVLAGAPEQLSGAASVTGSDVRISGRPVERAAARLSLEGGRIHVERLIATDPKGTLIATGTIERDGELRLRVRGTGVELGEWMPAEGPANISGTAYLVGDVTGSIRDPRLTATVDLYDAKYGELAIDYGRGQLIASREAVTLDPESGFVARLYPAELQLRGDVRALASGRPELNLTATLRDLEIGRFLAGQGEEPVALGVASGSLAIRGTLKAPRATGSLTVADATVRGIELGTLHGDLSLGDGNLALSNLRATGEGLTVSGGGSIGLVDPPGPADTPTVTRESPVRLTLAVANLDLRQLNAQTAPYVDLSGKLALPRVEVQGTVGSPRATASLLVAPLVLNGETFARLAADLQWNGETVTLTNGILDAGPGSFRVAEARYRTRAKATKDRLDVTASLAAMPVGTLLEVIRDSGYLGTAEGAPLLNLMNRIPGNVGGQLTGPIRVQPGMQDTQIALRLDGSELLLPSVQLPPEEAAAGTPTATPAANPEAAPVTGPLTLAMRGSATYQAGQLNVPLFELSQSGGEAAVMLRDGFLLLEGARDTDGTVKPAGRINVSLNGYRMPLRLIGLFLPELRPLTGFADLQLDAVGPLRTPAIQASADADDPVIAGIPFTRLAVPRVDLTSNRLTIDGARLIKEHNGHEHRLTLETPAGGFIPFQWDPPGIPENQARQLVIRLDEQSLDLLNDLAAVKSPNPRVKSMVAVLSRLGNVRGQISALVTLAGTRAEPQNTGEVRLVDVGFALPGGRTELRDIEVRLAFAGDQVTVAEFTGESSRGGRFTVTGGIDLGRTAPPAGPLDLGVTLADLRIEGRNISGTLGETLAATLRTVATTELTPRLLARAPVAPIRITGTFASPLIAATGGGRGGILLHNSTLTLPAVLPPAAPAAQPPAVNPRFQMALIAGENVRIRNSRLRVELRGALPVSGTLAEPVLRGTLQVVQGRVQFPAAPPFRLTGEIAVNYAPGTGGSETPPYRLDLIARGVTRGTSPTSGRTQRYEITLTIRGSLTSEPLRLAGLEEDQGALGPRLGGAGLTIRAESSPPLSETQILALLGRQSAVQGIATGDRNIQDVFRQEFEQVLGSSVVPGLLAPTEFAVAEALGLEEFGLEFAFREPVRVRIGKRLFGGFYGTYIRSFAADQEQQSLELYYRLSERLRMGYRVEQPENQRVWLLEGSLRF